MPKARTKTKPKRRFSEVCKHCKRPTVFIIDFLYSLTDPPPEEYSLGHCETCGRPALFYREDISDDFDSLACYRVYPPQHRHLEYEVPRIVRESYQDAVGCELGGTWLGCAVLVGRTLEAVCKDFDPTTKGTFYDGLKSMLAKGVISRELFEWSDELRALRNVAAHPSDKPIGALDAKSALDFLQAILEIMYDLRPRFAQFKKQRRNQPNEREQAPFAQS